LPLLKNDITTTEGNFQIQDTLQISAIGLICDKLEVSKVSHQSPKPQHIVYPY
jgi:hypothetical protein